MRPAPGTPITLALAALLLASCSAISSVMGDLTGSNKQKEQEEMVARVQQEVMAFADVYVGEILAQTSRIPSPSRDVQVRLLTFQSRQAGAAYEIASGQNPLVNVVDMVILVTATRAWVDDRFIPQILGAEGKPLSDALARLEPQAWRISGQVLDASRQAQLRQFVAGWESRNDTGKDVSSLRLTDLSATTGSSSAGLGTTSDLLKSFGLDPFAGIDPAVQEVQRSRLLAERAFYFAKRWPSLLEIQTRLIALQLAAQPAPAGAFDDAHRISLAAESAARTFEGLPGLVDREREAAVRQFLDALQDQETRARALLAEMRRTLDAGTGAATAVHGALGSLEGILAITSAPAPAGSPPGHPFDVREYTRALEQLSVSAREVEGLLRSLNQDAPRLAALVGDAGREVSDRGRALVDHLFQRAIVLVLVLVGSSFTAALAYRWISSRMRRS
ncbi:MAG: hypothetical protein WB493_11595 [Anaeromyxobacteraceae bacterium]